MKTKLFILAVLVVASSSCSTMYKTGQTPDDVYYSPARIYQEGQQENKDGAKQEQAYNYNSEDRNIRMGITNYRYRYLNNDYGYSPYAFYDRHAYYGNNYTGNYYNFDYNHSYYNDYYYNPYYNAYPVYITPVGHIKNSTPRMTNLNGYTHHYNNSNGPLMPLPAVRPTTNPTGRSSGLGNILNKVFTPSINNNNNNTSNKTTERTYTPPPASNTNSSSSGSSSSGSSGSRITRPN